MDLGELPLLSSPSPLEALLVAAARWRGDSALGKGERELGKGERELGKGERTLGNGEREGEYGWCGWCGEYGWCGDGWSVLDCLKRAGLSGDCLRIDHGGDWARAFDSFKWGVSAILGRGKPASKRGLPSTDCTGDVKLSALSSILSANSVRASGAETRRRRIVWLGSGDTLPKLRILARGWLVARGD
jgi:hypothetical protein